MNNNGVGTSTVIARHDYLPFGEEIGSNVGLRSSSQGYSATDTNRWKYGMTERDDASGLDHTWWRKYESTSGRWTSPDPLSGRLTDPQSFNRYTYTQNDPVNFVDPSGLELCVVEIHITNIEFKIDGGQIVIEGYTRLVCYFRGGSGGGGGGGGGCGADGRGGGAGQKPKNNNTPLKPQQQKRMQACEAKKQLKKCERDAREKYAFTPHGPSLDDAMLPTAEDVGLSAAGGGVTGVLRLLGRGTLGAAAGAAGESAAIALLLADGYRQYKLGRAKGAAMQKAYDEEQNTIAKCRADFENTVREAGYDPQQVLTKQEWNDCH
jgi:RHS repeat-associated protein